MWTGVNPSSNSRAARAGARARGKTWNRCPTENRNTTGEDPTPTGDPQYRRGGGRWAAHTDLLSISGPFCVLPSPFSFPDWEGRRLATSFPGGLTPLREGIPKRENKSACVLPFHRPKVGANFAFPQLTAAPRCPLTRPRPTAPLRRAPPFHRLAAASRLALSHLEECADPALLVAWQTAHPPLACGPRARQRSLQCA